MKVKQLFCKHQFKEAWALCSIPQKNGTYKMGGSKECSKCGKIIYQTGSERYQKWRQSWDSTHKNRLKLN